MVTTNKKTDAIFIGVDEQRIELTGDVLEAFQADRKQMRQQAELVETEYQAKQKAREDAIKKLAEVAGLTEAELNAIL